MEEGGMKRFSERGNADEGAAGLEDPAHLLTRDKGILHVLEYRQGQYDVKGIIAKRQEVSIASNAGTVLGFTTQEGTNASSLLQGI
jgi:hypothetical protein